MQHTALESVSNSLHLNGTLFPSVSFSFNPHNRYRLNASQYGLAAPGIGVYMDLRLLDARYSGMNTLRLDAGNIYFRALERATLLNNRLYFNQCRLTPAWRCLPCVNGAIGRALAHA